MVCIIALGIDLSLGSVLGLSAVVTASLVQQIGWKEALYPGFNTPAVVALLAGLGRGHRRRRREREPDRGVQDPAVHRDPGDADHRPRPGLHLLQRAARQHPHPGVPVHRRRRAAGHPVPDHRLRRRHPAHAPDAQQHAVRAPGLRDRRQRDRGPRLGREHRPDEDPDLHLLGPDGGPRRRRAHGPRRSPRRPRWASATSWTRSPPPSSAAPASPAASARCGAPSSAR